MQALRVIMEQSQEYQCPHFDQLPGLKRSKRCKVQIGIIFKGLQGQILGRVPKDGSCSRLPTKFWKALPVINLQLV